MSYKGFTSVQLKKPTRSVFDLTHEKKLTCRMGELVPIFISETMPNDTFRCDSEVMLRLAPLLAPIMHRINVFVHYFFVPNRLLWSRWEDFITTGQFGTTNIMQPFVRINEVLAANRQLLAAGSLSDYLGGPVIPDGTAGYSSAQEMNLLPFAAYLKIWFDYYRDRNFQQDTDLMPIQSVGLQTANHGWFLIRSRCWAHDYFTSSLPWTQRGAQVLMPLAGSGSVTYSPVARVRRVYGLNILDATNIRTQGTDTNPGLATGGSATEQISVENIASVNLTASSVTINDLRRAVRLQEWMERNALAGSRYNESILAHFGRRTSDARLQRAEYLGGGRVPVQISGVVTTAWSAGPSGNTPPANLAGHGISYGKSNKFSYNCEEHGFIIGIMSVMPRADYFQGVDRMFNTRQSFLDYPWPSFAHLGEQPVYASELWTSPDTMGIPQSRPIFGYQSRYAEWKFKQNTIHGDFRSSMQFWHLARTFSSQPALGIEFNTFDDALPNRIFAVSGGDHLWCYINNRCTVKRSLPYYGTPML